MIIAPHQRASLFSCGNTHEKRIDKQTTASSMYPPLSIPPDTSTSSTPNNPVTTPVYPIQASQNSHCIRRTSHTPRNLNNESNVSPAQPSPNHKPQTLIKEMKK